MENNVKGILDLLIQRYPSLESCRDSIAQAYEIITEAYNNSGILLVAGNGGSASDAQHIVGELMKGFIRHRPVDFELAKDLEDVDSASGRMLAENLQKALPAIALDAHSSLATAILNDLGSDLIFAQQVNGYGHPGSVFLGISTSGESRNIVCAAITAKAKGMKVISLTGEKESRLSELSDACIRVPESETYKVQELHLPVYHCICSMLEDTYFSK